MFIVHALNSEVGLDRETLCFFLLNYMVGSLEL
jgi:hypothetical protein